MISLRKLHDDADGWAAALLRRGFQLDLDGLLDLDRRRKESQAAARSADAPLRRRARVEASACLRELRARLLAVPNEPSADTPPGQSRAEDRVVGSGGRRGRGRPHGELLAGLGWTAPPGTCFRRATSSLVGPAARHLEVLAGRLLAAHLARPGCVGIDPARLVSRDTLVCSAHLPALARRLVPVPGTRLYVAPDGEPSLLAYLRARAGRGGPLPQGAACRSICLRTSPPGYGRLRGGLWRPAAYLRTESLWAVEPQGCAAAVRESLCWMSTLAASFGLAWRVRRHCAGRLSFASRSGYSLEVWAAGVCEYVEIGVVRDYGGFLSERCGLRRFGGHRPDLVSVVAFHVPRLYACLLESGLHIRLEEGVET